MPSKNELYLMYANLHLHSVGDFTGGVDGHYWSSSDQNGLTAWFIDFDNGDESNFGKNAPYRVRAARAF